MLFVLCPNVHVVKVIRPKYWFGHLRVSSQVVEICHTVRLRLRVFTSTVSAMVLC